MSGFAPVVSLRFFHGLSLDGSVLGKLWFYWMKIHQIWRGTGEIWDFEYMVLSLGGLKGFNLALLVLVCEAVSTGEGVLVVKPVFVRVRMREESPGYVLLFSCENLQVLGSMENAGISLSESERDDLGNFHLGLAIVLMDFGKSDLGLLVFGGHLQAFVMWVREESQIAVVIKDVIRSWFVSGLQSKRSVVSKDCSV
ncbi:unnamed protein product [Arabidopsis arenosa]|uniref:Uncharacterized protein n=1 Tax=Arabidopsis arenosa TaxID=38785 RepID=A0A8S1ZXX6_ARAAE|nr:unnamed protein product [Arabidopsis arenosa]